MREDLLIVLCRPLQDGEVLRCLVPPLSPRQASAAYAACLMDTERTAQRVARADVWFACRDAPSEALRGILSPGTHFVHQPDAEMSERVRDAFLRGFGAGYRRVVVVGSQTPDLPPAYITTAFDRMHDDPELAALGQSLDGGVYLAGLSRFQGELFDKIPWDDPTTWLALRAAAARAGIPLAILPRWQSVETFSDLLDCLARRGAANLIGLHEHGILQPCEAA